MNGWMNGWLEGEYELYEYDTASQSFLPFASSHSGKWYRSAQPVSIENYDTMQRRMVQVERQAINQSINQITSVSIRLMNTPQCFS
mmetsp:Transcript_1233/g.1744  ORF Transcript_1233/g.1744 Transcript_1233/m.1744 type:complete len:86 (-) Transcript_1233:68-325(-)